MIHTVEELRDKYNAYYKAKPNKWASEERNKFAYQSVYKYLDISKPTRILDIGCGNGHTLEYFKNLIFAGRVSFYGIDLSDEAIKLAKKRVPEGHFFCGLLGDEDWVGDGFDIILMLGVMEHLEDPETELKRVKALLAPGGICYTEIPNCIGYPGSEKVEGFRELNTGNHQFEWHLFRPTWDKRLTDAGFEIVESLTGPSIQTEFCYILR